MFFRCRESKEHVFVFMGRGLVSWMDLSIEWRCPVEYDMYMIAVFTGEGKGKTTAAIGDMIRAVGAGKRAIMFQFIKGPWISGEHTVLAADPYLKGKIKIIRGGKGFVGIQNDTISFAVHKAAARKTLAAAAAALASRTWYMVVLDEINVAVSLKLLTISQVLSVLKKVPADKIVICTGRGAKEQLIRRADLVTDMKEIKHPFQKGIVAQKGFDY